MTVECDAQTQKTSVKPNAGKAAKWNEKLSFQKSQILSSDTLRVRVWDRDHASSDDKASAALFARTRLCSTSRHSPSFVLS